MIQHTKRGWLVAHFLCRTKHFNIENTAETFSSFGFAGFLGACIAAVLRLCIKRRVGSFADGAFLIHFNPPDLLNILFLLAKNFS